MSSIIDQGSARPRPLVPVEWRTRKFVTAWLCLCPLLAIATTWRIALVLAVCLLVAIALTSAALALLRRHTQPALRLPLAALIAGTVAVLLQLAMAAAPIDTLQSLDASVTPWLVLVAGLAVLVCCLPDEADSGATVCRPSFLRSVKLAVALSIALLLIGVARDAFGRVMLLAATPVGALVLLALLLALITGCSQDRPASRSSPARTSSPLDPGLRRDDEQNQNSRSFANFGKERVW